MKNIKNTGVVVEKEPHKSKAGYTFNEDDTHWQLNKNTKVNVGAVREILNYESENSYIKTLTYYAKNNSPKYAENINSRFLHYLRTTCSSEVNVENLINYRSILKPDTEHYLGYIKAFLNKWYELNYPGVSNETIDLLNNWILKGNIKGDVVKRLDPRAGPLSTIELQGFNEGIIQVYEKNEITITELAIGLIVSATGRRELQIASLRVLDVLKGKNLKGEDYFLINIPRIKQRNTSFRELFKQFAINHELWVILNAQVENVKRKISILLPFEFQNSDLLELPIFPDWKAITKVNSIVDLRLLFKSDELHIKSRNVTKTLKKISKKAQIHSERTGEYLEVTSTRFRYSVGTRAAREGFGEMVIAELLDHTDTQSAHVYIENVPEHVARLDQALGHQLAIYAQAFAGVLVDAEKDAQRGSDINSRVKADGTGIGTCGSYGFCGANIPIPCYTCMHFQPWLDGPHQFVYDELISERERLMEVTGDMTISAVNDRSILAVANVIQLCTKRREELGNG